MQVSRRRCPAGVVSIADGDTLTLLVDGREQVKVRLAEIDTPERRQPYGNKAQQALVALAFDKDAIVMWSERDRYGRVVGRVFVDGLDVNAEMVRGGARLGLPTVRFGRVIILLGE